MKMPKIYVKVNQVLFKLGELSQREVPTSEYVKKGGKIKPKYV